MSEDGNIRRVVVGVTGASGAPYAKRLLACITAAGVEAHVVFSPNGQRLFADELDITDLSAKALVGPGPQADLTTLYPYRDVGARIASGSFATDGMIVCPCSSSSLAAIANGLGENLLHRAAAVTLKERRRLIVMPREMPMSHIELRNCLLISEAGGVICPAAPGFYMLPQRVEDLVDFVVGKLLDLVNIPHTLNTRWAEQLASSRSKAE